MRTATRRTTDEISSPALWVLSGILAVVAAVLLWMVWRVQFTAPAGYLFDMPTPAAEAGYCLSVATGIVPGGAPVGSYFDESAQFWIGRLSKIGAVGMAQAIGQGHERLMADRNASGGREQAWMMLAMDRCSNRAVTYGAHFRSFE